MEQPSYYAILPANVRYDKGLKPMEKIMFAELTALSNKDGFCSASNGYFAELYDADESTVSRWIKRLADKGYVSILIIRNDKKAIIGRHVFTIPIDKKVNTLLTKKSIPSPQKSQYPIDKKVIVNNTSINTTSINREERIEKTPLPVPEKPNAIQWGDNSEARLEKATTAVKEYFTQYPDRIPALCQQARNRCNERGFWDEIGEYLRHHADNFQIMQNPIKALTSGPSNFVSWLSKPWCRDKYAALQPDQQPKRRAVTHQLRPERERITPEQVEALREKHNIR